MPLSAQQDEDARGELSHDKATDATTTTTMTTPKTTSLQLLAGADDERHTDNNDDERYTDINDDERHTDINDDERHTDNDDDDDEKLEDGEVEPGNDDDDEEDAAVDAQQPQPQPPPPLPSEPVPDDDDDNVDDGWDCQWDARTQAWFFYNRFSGRTQWENPRQPLATKPTIPTSSISASSSSAAAAAAPPHLSTAADDETPPVAGGYNPAIHGDYDPEAWYAKGSADNYDDDDDSDDAADADADDDADGAMATTADMYAATAAFNRFHGGGFSQPQSRGGAGAGAGRHSDEAKACRQMNAYFDASAASAAHDGRSLKAERQNRKPTRAELRAFKEKRRARKEEKRRAWLRD